MTEWRYTKGDQKGKPMPKGKTPDEVIVMPSLNAMAKERTGYPTQKPLALLDRIIRASSNEGDVVLDPFCGCATTLVAADRLGRQWAGIDLSAKAAELVVQRLEEDQRPLWRNVVHRTDVPQRDDLGPLPCNEVDQSPKLESDETAAHREIPHGDHKFSRGGG